MSGLFGGGGGGGRRPTPPPQDASTPPAEGTTTSRTPNAEAMRRMQPGWSGMLGGTFNTPTVLGSSSVTPRTNPRETIGGGGSYG